MDSYLIDVLSKLNYYDKDYKFDRNDLIWEHFNSYIPFNTVDPSVKIWQKFKTPESICDQLVNEYKDKFDTYDKICVLFNPEIISSIIKNLNINLNNVYFISDNKEKTKWLNNELPEINVKQLKSYNPKNVKETMKEFDIKKFDCVFSNPPYNNNIDLKILKEIKDLYNYAVIVHPAGYLLDKKFKSKIYNEIRNTNHLEKVILFGGNKIFNIALFVPCCISVWNNLDEFNEVTVVDNVFSKSTYFCNINNISVHGNNYKLVNLIKEKYKNIINKYGVLSDNIIDIKNQTNYSVKFSLIRGHFHESGTVKQDFFTLLQKNYKLDYCDKNYDISDEYKKRGYLRAIWSFKNEIERVNFSKFLTTKIIRFALTFYKNNNNISPVELSLIPWLDFSQEWNDKKLVELFKFTEEEWKYIDKFISSFYDDYVSGF